LFNLVLFMEAHLHNHHKKSRSPTIASMSDGIAMTDRKDTVNPAHADYDARDRAVSEVKLGGVGEGSAIGDLFDVNGAEFWNHWVEAGGDMDAYVKDNLPNYGLVGALLLTITYPLILEPPGNLGGSGAESTASTTFVVMMVVATLLNFVLIIMSIVIYTQYCCCVNDISRLRFTGHFGYLVPAMVMLIVGQVALLAVATGLAIWANSAKVTLYISVIAFVVIISATVGLVIWIPMWNQKYNYVEEVASSAKERKEETRKSV